MSDGQTISLQLFGVGWAWVSGTEPGGYTWLIIPKGDYTIRQYVYFTAGAEIRGVLDGAFDGSTHVISTWLTPALPLQEPFFTPTSTINAQPASGFARLWTKLAPTTVDDGIRKAAEQKGRDKFRAALEKGTTITLNTVSPQQMDVMVGLLANGVVPQRPLQTPRWLLNERQQLHQEGVQIAGPFPMSRAVILDVQIESGFDFQYTAACAEAATRLATGQPLTSSMPPMTHVRPGHFQIPIVPPPCPWALITTSQGETDARVALLPTE